MRLRIVVVMIAAIAAGTGCKLVDTIACKVAERRNPPPPTPPTFSRYHLAGWRWEDVSRVVILPIRNESIHPRAAEEIRAALASELQRLGRFEVVVAPADDRAELSSTIHNGGRFDEAVMLDAARDTRADVVIHATITQYSPYPRPRIGLVIQAVGPREAKVIASVDGLWDTADSAVAERLRTFYRQRPKEKPPWIRNHDIASDDVFSAELALDSPALFQRWVCRESALTLIGLPVPGVIFGEQGKAGNEPKPEGMPVDGKIDMSEPKDGVRTTDINEVIVK